MSVSVSLSVVVNTYDGADVLPRALASVVSQRLDDVQVVVVDDGSDYAVRDLVRSRFPGQAVEVVQQENGGLSSARNLGARTANGEFIVFLDDDDELLPGALDRLRGPIAADVAVVSGAVEVLQLGSPPSVSVRNPPDLGPEMDHEVANYLAGSFAVRRSLLLDLGGFDELMRCNHQRELFLRLVPEARARGLRLVPVDGAVMRMYRRAPEDRPRNDPERLHGCLERMLEVHGERLRRNPDELASLQANAAVAAIRTGRYSRARSLLMGAIRIRPTRLGDWGRLAAACVPPVARRLW